MIVYEHDQGAAAGGPPGSQLLSEVRLSVNALPLLLFFIQQLYVRMFPFHLKWFTSSILAPEAVPFKVERGYSNS